MVLAGTKNPAIRDKRSCSAAVVRILRYLDWTHAEANWGSSRASIDQVPVRLDQYTAEHLTTLGAPSPRLEVIPERTVPHHSKEETAVNDTIQLVAEGEAGAIYHDEQNDEWLVDVASKGITLYFDREEFEQFLELQRQAMDYHWDVKLRNQGSSGLRASGE